MVRFVDVIRAIMIALVRRGCSAGELEDILLEVDDYLYRVRHERTKAVEDRKKAGGA